MSSIASVAAREQAWNHRQLEQPVVVPQWRVWVYEQPALVLGCSQRALYERLLATPGGPPMEVLLRGSGGGAVLAGPWLLGLSLAFPLKHPWLEQGLLESYRHIGQLCRDALAVVGVAAQCLAPAQISVSRSALLARGLPTVDWACFGDLAPWELVDATGRKVAGLAQRRRRTGALLVAGILLADAPWPLLCAPLGRSGDAEVLQLRTASCAALSADDLPRGQLVKVLTARLQGGVG